jgi:hypothetical protein
MKNDKIDPLWVGGGLIAIVLVNRLVKLVNPKSANEAAYSRPKQHYRVAGTLAKVVTSPGPFATTVMRLYAKNANLNTIIGNGRFESGWLDDYVQVYARTLVNGQMQAVTGWVDTDYITPIL